MATTRLLRYQVPYGASLSTVRKLSSVGASGQNVGGMRKISAVGLKALRNIITNGMTKMMVTTAKTTIRSTFADAYPLSGSPLVRQESRPSLNTPSASAATGIG